MWGVWIGLFGIGLTLWQILRGDSAPSSAALPVPNAARSPAGFARTREEVQARAKLCGLMLGDMRDAQRWVEKYLGQGVELIPGLTVMLNVVAYVNWPRSAQRVHCVYMNGPVPPPLPPSVGRQVEDAVFPRYGG